MKTRMLGAVALGLMVAACGTNTEDRVTGGAAAGAATGAGVGALGGPVGALAGAAIGGGAGAVTGAVTEPSQVNLGEPVWNDPNVRVPGVTNDTSRSSARAGSSSSSNTRELQRALSQRGFDVGPVDGIYGARTRQAVMDYQRQHNMQVTGRPNSQMMSDLGVHTSGRASTAQSDRNRAYMGGGMVGDGRSGTTGNTGSMGTTGTGAGAATGGAMGGGTTGMTRPNPSSSTGSGAIPTPSNNPMNDPTGGAGSATRPGLNQNRDSGGSGSSGSGSR